MGNWFTYEFQLKHFKYHDCTPERFYTSQVGACDSLRNVLAQCLTMCSTGKAINAETVSCSRVSHRSTSYIWHSACKSFCKLTFHEPRA